MRHQHSTCAVAVQIEGILINLLTDALAFGLFSASIEAVLLSLWPHPTTAGDADMPISSEPINALVQAGSTSLKTHAGKYIGLAAGGVSAAGMSYGAALYGATIGAWVGSVIPVTGTLIGASVGAATASALAAPYSISLGGIGGFTVGTRLDQARQRQAANAEASEH